MENNNIEEIVINMTTEDLENYLEIWEGNDGQENEIIAVKKELNKRNGDETIEDKNNKIYENNESWNVPMNTEYINDKKMDYKTLGIITYFSNRKSEEVCDLLGLDISEVEHHRYLYEKGNNSIWSNKSEIEQMSKSRIDNFKRNINKLVKCGNDVVSICKDKEGKIYYKINPYAKDKDGMGKFVIIDSRILEYLCNTYDSTTIKTYCTLAWLCRDGEKMITREYLCSQVGLSRKSLRRMSDILFALDEKLIEIRYETAEVNKISRTRSFIKVYTLKEFKDNKNKKKIKSKNKK